MKHLLLCRHAKSSWKDSSLTDFDRPLNKRGTRDAPRMGKLLDSHGVHPDLIVSSPAKRTRKTALALAKRLKYPKKRIVYLEAVYAARPEDLLNCIHSFDDRYNRIILVCHNSELTSLANSLGNLTIPNVPTCGIVALDFKVDSWRAVKKKKGELSFFYYPKMLGKEGSGKGIGE